MRVARSIVSWAGWKEPGSHRERLRLRRTCLGLRSTQQSEPAPMGHRTASSTNRRSPVKPQPQQIPGRWMNSL